MTTPLAPVTKTLWIAVLVRGILAIAFGIIAIIAPVAALSGIAIVYGVYVLVDGVTTLVHAVRSRSTDPRWGWLVVQGVLSVIAGLVVLVFPAAAGTLGGYVVLWTIVIFSVMHGVTGLMSAAGASATRGRASGIVSGVVSILAGVLLGVLTLVTPHATLFALASLVGAGALLFGVVLIVTALRVRRGIATAGL
jgi:uncharacterized membrane protein HdeD (DUF308 family)